MIDILPILAQEGAPSGGGGFGIGSMIPFILIMVMFYFILIRPQRKQQKAQEEMRKNLRKGDKVVSIGGIHGIVTGATDRTVSVKVAEGLSLKFDRSAIATVVDSSKSIETTGDDSHDTHPAEEKES